MKILHLNDERWDSGITAYANQICEILKKNEHEVTIGVRPGQKPEKLAKKMGLSTIIVRHPLELKKVLKQQKWDIINAHNGRTHSWSVIANKLLSRSKRVPVIRTRGDARPLSINPLIRFVYRHTAAVIAASEHIRKQYEFELGLHEEIARTIYPSVDTSQPYHETNEEKVGILARLDPVKGHTIFLEAAAKVLREYPKVKFLVAGKEAGVSIQILINHAKELGIQDAVKFLGFQESAVDFMRSCRIGVISSIGSEEVSRACLEWMSVGRPVVGTIVGCLPELIEPQESGYLVPPGDSEALAQSLMHLLANSSKTITWGKAGMEIARRRFSPQVQLEKTLRVYQWALRESIKN